MEFARTIYEARVRGDSLSWLHEIPVDAIVNLAHCYLDFDQIVRDYVENVREVPK